MFGLAKECGCKFTFGSDSHADGDHARYAEICQTVAGGLELEEKDLAELVG
jgi:histidinol phosphatase-like PHP family hydrolase